MTQGDVQIELGLIVRGDGFQILHAGLVQEPKAFQQLDGQADPETLMRCISSFKVLTPTGTAFSDTSMRAYCTWMRACARATSERT